MFSKLALRNVKKTIQDYSVYLITMILVTALMFAFHSMMFSPQIKIKKALPLSTPIARR